MKKYKVIFEQNEDGTYFAYVPELPGCESKGETIRELTENIQVAIELYLESEENT
jgi:predicted RNase H-like HicB family nuclease